MHEYELSRQEVDAGRPLAESVQDHQMRADFLQIEGMLALQGNRPNEAVSFLSEAHELEYRDLEPKILTIYAIALARTKDFPEANNVAILAVDACDEQIREVPKHYEMYYYRGLAQAALSIVDVERPSQYRDQMFESYRRGYEICHEPGDLQFQRLLLAELKPLDNSGLLAPVFNLLAGVTNAAA